MTTTETKTWTRALSVAALAAAGILLSGCSLLGQVQGITDPTTGGDGGDTTEGTEDDVFSLVPGDCFNDVTDEDTVSSVDIVDCETPHTWEAYESIIMTQTDFPGDDAVQSEADASCNDPFTAYVGLTYDASIYDYNYFTPIEESWNDPVLQDREILCLAFADDSSLITGSVKGSNK